MTNALPSATEGVPKATWATASRLENRLASGSVASFFSLLLAIGSAIVQVPILLDAWGQQAYGAWLLVTAVYSTIISLDLGHQNFVANKISMIGLLDVAACRRVLGSAVKTACLIGAVEVAVAVAVVASGVFSVWLPGEAAALTDVKVEAVVALLAQTLFFAFVGSIGGIVVRLYVAAGLYARAQWTGVAQRITMFLALIGAVACGLNMTGATLAYLIAGGTVFFGFTCPDLKKRFPEYWPWWRGGSLQIGLHHAFLSLGLTAVSVSDQCAAAGLLGIAGASIHATGVATLGTLRTLANSILQAASVVVLPVLPDLSRFAASGDQAKAAATLSAIWLLSTTPLCIVVSALGPTVGPFFSWWTRGSLPFSTWLFVLLALGALARQWQSPMALFLFSANRLRAQVVVSVVRTASLLTFLGAGFFMSNDLAVAGFAVLVSEVVSATAVTAYAVLFFRDMGGSLPTNAAVLAALQVGISGCSGLTWVGGRETRVALLVACLLAHLAIGMMQWRTLPGEVRHRMRRLIRKQLATAS